VIAAEALGLPIDVRPPIDGGGLAIAPSGA
jgi:hypothetical protein